MTPDDEITRRVEAVWRIEAAGVVAALARMTGDLSLAEDLAQDAFVAALQQWQMVVPDNPRAWLVTVAKRRFVDHVRRRVAIESRAGELERQELERQRPSGHEEDEVGQIAPDDDVLRLAFSCCHPVLAREAQVALTLRAVAGLTTRQIAHAFLVPERTIAQRIVRAKRTLSSARVRFELPAPNELEKRLEAVLEIVYLVFNEGYVPTSGDRWSHEELCREALRLGRILAARLPASGEVHGLIALMELQTSRLRARSGAGQRAVLLAEQDRTAWDRVLIERGLAALERAGECGPGLGWFGLQAAIAACHARAKSFEETDWSEIVACYDALVELRPSPVVELNRAVALSFAEGASTALSSILGLEDDRRLSSYHLYWSTRAELHERLGELDAARTCLSRALSLVTNEEERRLLFERATRLGGESSPSTHPGV